MDIKAEIDARFATFRKEVAAEFDRVGQEAVEIAKASTAYHDVTGHLRASNEYEAHETELIIRNTADYASQVEARCGNVTADAVLYAKNALGAH